MMKSIQKRFLSHEIIRMLLASLFLTSQAYGQPDPGMCVTMPRETMPGSYLLTTPYRDMNPFENLPGEINQWGWGTVYLQTGDSVPERRLLYNALGSNLLWIKNEGKSCLLVDKSTVKSFSFLSERDNQVLRYEFFPVPNWYYSDEKGAFLEVLVKDSLSLYRLCTIERFPMSDNLKTHNYYFIRQPGSDLDKIMPNRRSLCNAIDNSEEFRKHLRSIHLRGKKRERITRAVQEYNHFIRKAS